MSLQFLSFPKWGKRKKGEEAIVVSIIFHSSQSIYNPKRLLSVSLFPISVAQIFMGDSTKE